MVPVIDSTPAILKPAPARLLDWLMIFIKASLWVAGAAIIALLLQRLPHANLSVVFLAAVVIVATLYGMSASVYASIASFFVFNFFFTTPLFTLWVGEQGDVATLVFYISVAVLSGHLAARLRDATLRREIALNRVSNLYEFSHRMARAGTADEVLTALKLHLEHTFAANVFVELHTGIETDHADADADVPTISPGNIRRRQVRCDVHGCHTPLLTSQGEIGRVTLALKALSEEQRDLLSALVSHASLAYERTRFAEELRQAQLDNEAERLRSALLSSVSHDLRTPLASIIGSATSLLEYGDSIDAGNRRELLQAIAHEAQRLNRYIQNLLDMTRLGQGDIRVVRDWIDLNDIIATVRNRLESELESLDFAVSIEPAVALIHVNGSLIEQAIVNVVENAIRYSPADGRISLQARKVSEQVFIDVCDDGPGIAPEQRDRIFDMFYSASQGQHIEHGTGLGLAICRSLIHAHGGEVQALPGVDGRGTCIRMTLPMTSERHD